MPTNRELSPGSALRLRDTLASYKVQLQMWHDRLDYYSAHNVAYVPIQHELQEALEAIGRAQELLKQDHRRYE